MIKSFIFNSGLITDHWVLAKGLSDKNRKMIEALPRTRVYDLHVHNAPDHWCTWILELFYLENLADYDYVFYTDTDIMVRKELESFVDKFYERAEDDVCVIDHKKSWHTKWFYRKAHNFNAGFIVFKGSFFGSDTHQRLKVDIQIKQPMNDEQYLRSFFGKLLYAPTKFNARLIWLPEQAIQNDDISVLHFVGQENKPWLKNNTRWTAEWHRIFNRC